MIVLAIDPAKTTGWACSDGRSGAQAFGAGTAKLSGQDRHGLVGLRFDSWLDGMLSATGAAVLVLERQMTHGTSAHLLLGLRMLALVRARGRSLLVDEVWVSSWQPWARRELAWWRKDDELDARALLAFFTSERLPRLVEVAA